MTDELDAKSTTWDAGFVTHATKKFIEEFVALPDQDRSELVAGLARRVALAPHGLPEDEDLLASADRLFVELDRRESSECRPGTVHARAAHHQSPPVSI